MRLGEVGEFNFIDRIAALTGHSGAEVLVGIGDDAAVLDTGSPEKLIVTTDAMVEGVHFRTEWLTYEEIGWRAMAACLSDIAAMGARPVATFASVALPADLDADLALDLTRGLAKCAEACGTALVGGDCAASPQRIFIDVMAVGTAKEPWLRSGAQPGDVLMVTGCLGDAAAAVAMLSNGQQRDAIAGHLLNSFVRPGPRLREAATLAESEIVRAALDISDGLVQDAGHLAKQSNLGIRINSQTVPISDNCRQAALALDCDALQWGLAGGEDFELLLAMSEDGAEEAAQLLRDGCGTNLTVIGQIVEGDGVTVLDANGQEIPVPRAGWDHFGE